MKKAVLSTQPGTFQQSVVENGEEVEALAIFTLKLTAQKN